MSTKQTANRIAQKFVTKSIFDMDSDELKQERLSAKKHATTCVIEIINAIEITTGHCELRKIDAQEVNKD